MMYSHPLCIVIMNQKARMNINELYQSTSMSLKLIDSEKLNLKLREDSSIKQFHN